MPTKSMLLTKWMLRGRYASNVLSSPGAAALIGPLDIEVARRSASGSFILFAGNIISAAILAVTAIVVTRLLGPDRYGAYTLLLVLPLLLQSFVGLGINIGITRYAAFHISKGEPEVARRLTIHALIFIFLSGGFLFLVALIGSSYLSTFVLHRPELTGLSEVASSLILVQTLFQSVNAALLGFGAMRPIGLSTIAQAALKFVFSVSLILIGLGVLGALLGQMVGLLVAGSLTGGVLYLRLPKRLATNRRTFVDDIREMLRYGLPVYIGGLAITVAGQYVTIVLSAIASNVSVGYYMVAMNVVIVINGYFISAIATALFPAFATLQGVNGDTRLAFGYSVQYMGYFSAPSFIFALGAAGPLTRVLYGAAFVPAAAYLVLLSVAYLPVLMGLSAQTPFFNGVGLTRQLMYVNLAGAAAIFVLAPLLSTVMGFGIPGLIYSLLASNLLMAVLGLALAIRRARATVFFKPMVSTLASTLLALFAVLTVQLLVAEPFVALGVDVVVFLFVYLTAMPLLRGVGAADLERLDAVIRGLGFFSRIMLPILGYERRLVKRRVGVAKKTSSLPSPVDE